MHINMFVLRSIINEKYQKLKSLIKHNEPKTKVFELNYKTHF